MPGLRSTYVSVSPYLLNAGTCPYVRPVWNSLVGAYVHTPGRDQVVDSVTYRTDALRYYPLAPSSNPQKEVS